MLALLLVLAALATAGVVATALQVARDGYGARPLEGRDGAGPARSGGVGTGLD